MLLYYKIYIVILFEYVFSNQNLCICKKEKNMWSNNLDITIPEFILLFRQNDHRHFFSFY